MTIRLTALLGVVGLLLLLLPDVVLDLQPWRRVLRIGKIVAWSILRSQELTGSGPEVFLIWPGMMSLLREQRYLARCKRFQNISTCECPFTLKKVFCGVVGD